jgi:hypothetical protein
MKEQMIVIAAKAEIRAGMARRRVPDSRVRGNDGACAR